MDKNGEKQVYFDGNHPSDEHVCACNTTDSCAEAPFDNTCNCDAER